MLDGCRLTVLLIDLLEDEPGRSVEMMQSITFHSYCTYLYKSVTIYHIITTSLAEACYRPGICIQAPSSC